VPTIKPLRTHWVHIGALVCLVRQRLHRKGRGSRECRVIGNVETGKISTGHSEVSRCGCNVLVGSLLPLNVSDLSCPGNDLSHRDVQSVVNVKETFGLPTVLLLFCGLKFGGKRGGKVRGSVDMIHSAM